MENTIAKAVRYIGIAVIAVGIISGIFADEAFATFGFIIGGVISGVIFIGFSEIINLLQQNADNQTTIINKLNKQNNPAITENQSSPNIATSTHLFRCNKCGKMIDKKPCIYCGYSE